MPPKRRSRASVDLVSEDTNPPKSKRLKTQSSPPDEVITLVCSPGEEGGDLPIVYQVTHKNKEDSDKFFSWIVNVKPNSTQTSLVSYFAWLAENDEVHNKTNSEKRLAEASGLDDLGPLLKELESIEYGEGGAGRWKKLERSHNLISVGSSQSNRLVFLYTWC